MHQGGFFLNGRGTGLKQYTRWLFVVAVEGVEVLGRCPCHFAIGEECKQGAFPGRAPPDGMDKGSRLGPEDVGLLLVFAEEVDGIEVHILTVGVGELNGELTLALGAGGLGEGDGLQVLEAKLQMVGLRLRLGAGLGLADNFAVGGKLYDAKSILTAFAGSSGQLLRGEGRKAGGCPSHFLFVQAEVFQGLGLVAKWQGDFESLVLLEVKADTILGDAQLNARSDAQWAAIGSLNGETRQDVIKRIPEEAELEVGGALGRLTLGSLKCLGGDAKVGAVGEADLLAFLKVEVEQVGLGCEGRHGGLHKCLALGVCEVLPGWGRGGHSGLVAGIGGLFFFLNGFEDEESDGGNEYEAYEGPRVFVQGSAVDRLGDLLVVAIEAIEVLVP